VCGGEEKVQRPVHKPSSNTQQLDVRAGNCSQKSSSHRMGRESLGTGNSPVMQVHLSPFKEAAKCCRVSF